MGTNLVSELNFKIVSKIQYFHQEKCSLLFGTHHMSKEKTHAAHPAIFFPFTMEEWCTNSGISLPHCLHTAMHIARAWTVRCLQISLNFPRGKSARNFLVGSWGSMNCHLYSRKYLPLGQGSPSHGIFMFSIWTFFQLSQTRGSIYGGRSSEVFAPGERGNGIKCQRPRPGILIGVIRSVGEKLRLSVSMAKTVVEAWLLGCFVLEGGVTSWHPPCPESHASA